MSSVRIPLIFVFDSDSFDPDQAKGQSTTRSQRLRQIGNFVGAITRAESPILFQRVIDADHDNEELRSLFSSSNLTSPAVQDLLDLLITEKQQEVRIIDGFHGAPTVGAMAFADAVAAGAWRDFESRLNEETQVPGDHFVVLAGGTAGGTGPGVLPVLAGEVMNWKRNRKKDAPKVDVSLVVQLPWFRIANREEDDLEYEAMQHNSACLVKQYYSNLENLADRVVLLGLQHVADRKSSGPNHQPEAYHYLNLASGWLSAELLANSQTRNEMSASGVYGLSFEDNEDPLRLTVTDSGGMVRKQIRLRDAVQASSAVREFCMTLVDQCRYPSDIALPVEVWRLLRGLGNELENFQRHMQDFATAEEEMLAWFSDVCSESTHAQNDPPKIFIAAAKDRRWTVGANRLGLPKHRHAFSGCLIRDANLLGVLVANDGSTGISEFVPKTGDELAAVLFSRLKTYLTTKLSETEGEPQR
jgi:hypothetical protein